MKLNSFFGDKEAALPSSLTQEQLDSLIQLSPRLLKLFDNSSSLNKGNHDCDGIWISDLN